MTQKFLLLSKKTLIFTCLFFCNHTIDANTSFDIHDKNIGFNNSPNPINAACLLPETFSGFSTTLYYNSAVEPSIAVNPKHHKNMVAVWQQDRFNNSGAFDIGIARSKNGGKHWKRSLMPFQNCNGGFTQRITDTWLSYSNNGKQVYLVGLALNASTDTNTQNQEGVVISTSENNGKSWSIPHYLISSQNSFEEPTGDFPVDDKPSVTADPFIKDNAYAVWDRYTTASSYHSDTWMSQTTNSGTSWQTSRMIYNSYPDLVTNNLSNGIVNDCSTTNNIIIGLPNGDLLNFMTRIYAAPGATDQQYINDTFPYQYTLFDIAFIRSTDLGVTWDTNATVVATIDGNALYTCGYSYSGNTITGGLGMLCRDFGYLFSVATNPQNGNIYLVWGSSQFRADQLQQIALVRSRDNGATWSSPVQVNVTPPTAANPQAFTPSVAVAANGYVGILYQDFRKSSVACALQTNTNVWLDLYQETTSPTGGSTGVGLNFVDELRVSKDSYIIENGPMTTQGVMTNGDYNSLAAHKDDFYALYIKSHHGPFYSAQTLIDSPSTGILILDDNKRTSPYFSKIDAY